MTKRNLIALMLAVMLLVSCTPVSALFGEDKYLYIESIAAFIKENGYYSSPDDDPLRRALVKLLDTDEAAFDQLLGAMLASYDARSMLISSDYFEGLLQTSGYVGVGVTLSLTQSDAGDDVVTITALHPQGSAKRAGLAVGDVVVQVDDRTIESLGFAEIATIMRDGEVGSFVDVAVMREETRLHFTLERILLGEPEYAMHALNDDTYLMRWTKFRTPELMETCLEDLKAMEEAGARALILDLRGNGGGLLSMSFGLVEALIAEKDVHYLTMLTREGNDIFSEELKTSGGGGFGLEEIVILCDGDTASASEIIVTALCDTGHAISIGRRTYGKATAQFEFDTPQNSVIILTAHHMRTAKGFDYNLVGLEPTLSVENLTLPRSDPGLRLREVALSFGSCSDDADALNQALEVLGLMGAPQKRYRLGEDTQAALNNFRQQNGLERRAGLDIETATRINAALEGLPGLTEVVDRQLEKAMEYLSGQLYADASAGAAD